MRLWILQRWFNIAPWKNATYFQDNQGEKFWFYWFVVENIAKLRMRYRGYPAGYVNLIAENEDQLTLADIYVQPKYRSRGLGKNLLLEVLRWAQENRFQEISGFMKAHDGLPEEYIAEWYRRQGFEITGKQIYLDLRSKQELQG